MKGITTLTTSLIWQNINSKCRIIECCSHIEEAFFNKKSMVSQKRVVMSNLRCCILCCIDEVRLYQHVISLKINKKCWHLYQDCRYLYAWHLLWNLVSIVRQLEDHNMNYQVPNWSSNAKKKPHNSKQKLAKLAHKPHWLPKVIYIPNHHYLHWNLIDIAPHSISLDCNPTYARSEHS